MFLAQSLLKACGSARRTESTRGNAKNVLRSTHECSLFFIINVRLENAEICLRHSSGWWSVSVLGQGLANALSKNEGSNAGNKRLSMEYVI